MGRGCRRKILICNITKIIFLIFYTGPEAWFLKNLLNASINHLNEKLSYQKIVPCIFTTPQRNVKSISKLASLHPDKHAAIDIVHRHSCLQNFCVYWQKFRFASKTLQLMLFFNGVTRGFVHLNYASKYWINFKIKKF